MQKSELPPVFNTIVNNNLQNKFSENNQIDLPFLIIQTVMPSETQLYGVHEQVLHSVLRLRNQEKIYLKRQCLLQNISF